MSAVAQLEHQRAQNQTLIERRDLALRLEKNPEFKALILDQFCVQECARYAQLSADPSLKPEDRENALALAQAAGHLRRFLSVVVQMGNVAEGQMAELDEALVEARQDADADQGAED